MLLDLRISNLAIIEHSEIGCGPGLNVLTGETGAGKSILINALGLLVGERAAAEKVGQNGAGARALVEGAFDLKAVDYVLKPVRRERLAEAVRRVAEQVGDRSAPVNDTSTDQIPVELGGVIRFIPIDEIAYAEAQGDYARLHTAEGSHLVRTPLTSLAEQWASAGFVRIHRSVLVALPHVEEVRSEGGRVSVVIGGAELPVSRRHTRELRSVLTRREP